MYCAKCRYHAQDHLTQCPKCNVSWEEARKALGLDWIRNEGFPWLSAAPQAEPIASDLLDVDDILAPPPAPEPEPTASVGVTLMDIDDLPQFTSDTDAPSAATPLSGMVEKFPEVPILADPPSIEPIAEIEVDIPLEAETTPRALQSTGEPLDEVTPEEDFLARLSAEMPATDHILLEEPETLDTATPTQKITPSAVETAAEAELDLVLEIEEHPFADQEIPASGASASTPQSPARAQKDPASTELFISELEELLEPLTPPAAVAPQPSAPSAPPASSEEADDFAIILLDDDENASS